MPMKTTETVKPELGLRERKRATTRAALERIAIDLALEQGYERATVEAICAASMVSRRTFFNYFGTKESAFIGPPTPDPDERATDAFVHRGSDNIVTDLAKIMTATALNHEVDNDLILKRSRLIQATPELWEAMMARMRDSEDLFVALVLRRFAANGRSNDTGNDEAEARMARIEIGDIPVRSARPRDCARGARTLTSVSPCSGEPGHNHHHDERRQPMTQTNDAAVASSGGVGKKAVLLVFIGLMVTELLSSLNETIFATALPTIVGQLHGVDQMQWVMTAYLLTSTIALLVYGKIGDLIGRKGLFLGAIAIFIVGSTIGGFAGNMTWLIIGRAVQGIGGGGLIILSDTI